MCTRAQEKIMLNELKCRYSRMNYTTIRQRPKQFEQVTRLRIEEFDQLLEVFVGK